MSILREGFGGAVPIEEVVLARPIFPPTGITGEESGFTPDESGPYAAPGGIEVGPAFNR